MRRPIPISPLHSTPSHTGQVLNNISYDQYFSEDFGERNSQRLLTNKIESSTIKARDLIKSSVRSQLSPKSDDYENLSNEKINCILNPSSTPLTVNRRNLYVTNSISLLQTSKNQTPKPPQTSPPTLRVLDLEEANPEDDDAESISSCQLITSASLLVKQDPVKEATRVSSNAISKITPVARRQVTLPPQQQPRPPPPPLNPRHFINTGQQTETQTVNDQQTFDPELMKPPPMETAI